MIYESKIDFQHSIPVNYFTLQQLCTAAGAHRSAALSVEQSGIPGR